MFYSYSHKHDPIFFSLSHCRQKSKRFPVFIRFAQENGFLFVEVANRLRRYFSGCRSHRRFLRIFQRREAAIMRSSGLEPLRKV